MIVSFDDTLDGAVVGTAELQVNKAELGLAGDKPVLKVSYIILEGEMQGPNKDIDPAGEYVNHTVWLPNDQDDPAKIKNKKKMLMRFLKMHGIDTSQAVELADVPAFLVNNNVVVKALLDVDDYALKNRGEAVTAVKRFYPAD